uniref:Putative ixodes 26 kDa salivary protein n=1 Tax=Ixodes ricinus TaxID=34613 RepID=A0A0K8RFW3_IXORI
MKVVIGVLAFATITFGLKVPSSLKTYKKNVGQNEKYITIAVVFDQTVSMQENLQSNVGKWILDVFDEAQEKLSKELHFTIKFDITHILVAPNALSKEIKDRTVSGQMHGPTIVDAVRETYRKSLNPDVLCLITKDKFYYGYLTNALGFSSYSTLCEEVVPILLTFDWDTQDNVEETATLLSTLVKSSINDGKLKSTGVNKEYFDNCNIRYKPKGSTHEDDYLVLPINKDYYEYEY